jgi:hypothetical protein
MALVLNPPTAAASRPRDTSHLRARNSACESQQTWAGFWAGFWAVALIFVIV